MVLLVIAVTALLTRLIPSWVGQTGGTKPGCVFVNLGYSFLAAAAGGYVTARLATIYPPTQVLTLGIVVLAMAGLSALQSKGKLPIWYQLALVAVAPVGVFAGGLVRLPVLGIL